MATKSTSRFVCQSCGEDFLRWEGQCRSCGTWNSLVETVVRDAHARDRDAARAVAVGPGAARSPSATSARPTSRGWPPASASSTGSWAAGSCPGRWSSSAASRASASRRSSSRSRPAWRRPSCTRPARSRPPRSACAPRRLGLLEGDPGAARPGPRRARHRRDRRGRPAAAPGRWSSSTSIQTATVDELDGAAGSVGQVRESTRPADGLRQGRGHRRRPRRARHQGRRRSPVPRPSSTSSTRSSRSRASATRRCGWCARPRTASARPRRSACSRWPAHGLLEVTDPARAFLADHPERRRAASSRPRLEGSRPLLVEVQALVAPGRLRHARRARPAGSTRTGSALLVAVLGRRAGIGLGSHDVYANLAGGLSVAEPGLDLPVALALASSLRDRPIAPGHRGHRRGRAARRAARGQRPRAPPARGGPARASAARSCRRPGGASATPAIAGLRVRRGRHPPRGRPGRRGGGPIGAWRGPPAMLG